MLEMANNGVTTEPKRVCSNCGSTETRWRRKRRKNGTLGTPYPVWCRDGKGGNWCYRCRTKLVDHSKWHPIHNKIYNTRRLKFKGKLVFLDATPRVGVCNFCRAVVGEINAQFGKLCKQTQLNHEMYDEPNPLAHTVELCVPCNCKWHIAVSHTAILNNNR